jgi:hypothetical protein
MAATKRAAVGRRGSPMAESSSIPAAAWPDLRVMDWERSKLAEPDGTVWYDVNISLVHSETAAIPAASPTASVKRALVGIFKAHPRGDVPWSDYCVEVRERLRNRGIAKLPGDKTIQNLFYAWRTEQKARDPRKTPKKAARKASK